MPAPWPFPRRLKPGGHVRRGCLGGDRCHVEGRARPARRCLPGGGCAALFLSRALPAGGDAAIKVGRGRGKELGLRGPPGRPRGPCFPPPRPGRSCSALRRHSSWLRRARGGVAALGLRAALLAEPPAGPAEPIHSVQETSRVFLTSPYSCD